eukprot:g108.t1
MSLDRKVRVSFRLASELGKDPEGDDEGKKEFFKTYELLERGRQQRKDILAQGEELAAPDILVAAAEAAVHNNAFSEAEDSITEFFLQDPPKNQFYCRALFAQAQICAHKAKQNNLKGKELVDATQHAIHYILRTLEISTKPGNGGKYDFLIYNATVLYWNVSRPLFRKGCRAYLVKSMQKILDSLLEIENRGFLVGRDLEWIIKYCLIYSQCLEEAREYGSALDKVRTAYTKYQKLAELQANDQLLKDIQKMFISLCQHDSNRKSLDEVLKMASSDSNRQIIQIYILEAGEALNDVATIRKKIMEHLQKIEAFVLISAGEQEEKGGQTKSFSLSPLEQEVVVRLGHIAMDKQMYDIGMQCLTVLEKCSSLALGQHDTIRFQLLQCKGQLRAKSSSTVSTGGRISKIKRSIGERRYSAMKIARATQAMRTLERILISIKRMKADGIDLLHEASTILWNMSLPLLQDHLRHHVQRAFLIAVEALDAADSPLKLLRALLHYEVAKSELAADFLAKATVHANKAISLDYGAIELEGEETDNMDTNDKLRILDRFLGPLCRKLELKGSIYKEPEQ